MAIWVHIPTPRIPSLKIEFAMKNKTRRILSNIQNYRIALKYSKKKNSLYKYLFAFTPTHSLITSADKKNEPSVFSILHYIMHSMHLSGKFRAAPCGFFTATFARRFSGIRMANDKIITSSEDYKI